MKDAMRRKRFEPYEVIGPKIKGLSSLRLKKGKSFSSQQQYGCSSPSRSNGSSEGPENENQQDGRGLQGTAVGWLPSFNRASSHQQKLSSFPLPSMARQQSQQPAPMKAGLSGDSSIKRTTHRNGERSVIELYEDKQRNFAESSWKKERLQKRREKIKSMKFIRRLGCKLRSYITKCNRQIEQAKKNQSMKTDSKKKKEKKERNSLSRKQSLQIKPQSSSRGNYGTNSGQESLGLVENAKKTQSQNRSEKHILFSSQQLQPNSLLNTEGFHTGDGLGPNQVFQPATKPLLNYKGPTVDQQNAIDSSGKRRKAKDDKLLQLSLSSSSRSLSEDASSGKPFENLLKGRSQVSPGYKGASRPASGMQGSEKKSKDRSRKNSADRHRQRSLDMSNMSSGQKEAPIDANCEDRGDKQNKQDQVLKPGAPSWSRSATDGCIQVLEGDQNRNTLPSRDLHNTFASGLLEVPCRSPSDPAKGRSKYRKNEYGEQPESTITFITSDDQRKETEENRVQTGDSRARGDEALTDGEVRSSMNQMGQIELFKNDKHPTPPPAFVNITDPQISQAQRVFQQLDQNYENNQMVDAPMEEEEYYAEDSSEVASLKSDRNESKDAKVSQRAGTQQEIQKIDSSESWHHVERPLDVELSDINIGSIDNPDQDNAPLNKSPAPVKIIQYAQDPSYSSLPGNDSQNSNKTASSKGVTNKNKQAMQDLFLGKNEFFKLKENKFTRKKGELMPSPPNERSRNKSEISSNQQNQQSLNSQQSGENRTQTVGSQSQDQLDGSNTNEMGISERSHERDEKSIYLVAKFNRMRQVQDLQENSLSQVSEERESCLEQTEDYTNGVSNQVAGQIERLLSNNRLSNEFNDDSLLLERLGGALSLNSGKGPRVETGEQGKLAALDPRGPLENKLGVQKLKSMSSVLHIQQRSSSLQIQTNLNEDNVAKTNSLRHYSQIWESPQEISESYDDVMDKSNRAQNMQDSSGPNFIIHEVEKESWGSHSEDKHPPMTEIKLGLSSGKHVSSQQAQRYERSDMSQSQNKGCQASFVSYREGSYREIKERSEHGNSSSELASSYDQEAADFFNGNSQQEETKEVIGAENEIANEELDVMGLGNITRSKFQLQHASRNPQSQDGSNSAPEQSSESGETSSASLSSDNSSSDNEQIGSRPDKSKETHNKQVNKNIDIIEQSSEESIEMPYSPLPQRNDIEGRIADLTDMEVFYLTEIEQQCNADLMEKLQKEEQQIRKDIQRQEQRIRQKQQLKEKKDRNNAGARFSRLKAAKTAGLDGAGLHAMPDDQEELFGRVTRNEDAEKLLSLKSKLMRHETKKQAFAFNLYKNQMQEKQEIESMRQSITSGSREIQIPARTGSSLCIKLQQSNSKLFQLSAQNLLKKTSLDIQKMPDIVHSKYTASKKNTGQLNADSANNVISALNDVDMQLKSSSGSVSSQSLSSKPGSKMNCLFQNNLKNISNLTGLLRSNTVSGQRSPKPSTNPERVHTGGVDDLQSLPPEIQDDQMNNQGILYTRQFGVGEPASPLSSSDQGESRNIIGKAPNFLKKPKMPSSRRNQSSQILSISIIDEKNEETIKQKDRPCTEQSSPGDLRINDSEIQTSEQNDAEELAGNDVDELNVNIELNSSDVNEVKARQKQPSDVQNHMRYRSHAIPGPNISNQGLIDLQQQIQSFTPLGAESEYNLENPLYINQQIRRTSQNEIISGSSGDCFNVVDERVEPNSGASYHLNYQRADASTTSIVQQRGSRRGHQMTHQRKQSKDQRAVAGSALQAMPHSGQSTWNHDRYAQVFDVSAPGAAIPTNEQFAATSNLELNGNQYQESSLIPQQNQPELNQPQYNQQLPAPNQPGQSNQAAHRQANNSNNPQATFLVRSPKETQQLVVQQSFLTTGSYGPNQLLSAHRDLSLYEITNSQPSQVDYQDLSNIHQKSPQDRSAHAMNRKELTIRVSVDSSMNQPGNFSNKNQQMQGQGQDVQSISPKTLKQSQIPRSEDQTPPLRKQAFLNTVKNQLINNDISRPKQFTFSPKSPDKANPRSRNGHGGGRSDHFQRSMTNQSIEKITLFSPKNQPVNKSKVMKDVKKNLQSLWQRVRRIRSNSGQSMANQSQQVAGCGALSPTSFDNIKLLNQLPTSTKNTNTYSGIPRGDQKYPTTSIYKYNSSRMQEGSFNNSAENFFIGRKIYHQPLDDKERAGLSKKNTEQICTGSSQILQGQSSRAHLRVGGQSSAYSELLITANRGSDPSQFRASDGTKASQLSVHKIGGSGVSNKRFSPKRSQGNAQRPSQERFDARVTFGAPTPQRAEMQTSQDRRAVLGSPQSQQQWLLNSSIGYKSQPGFMLDQDGTQPFEPPLQIPNDQRYNRQGPGVIQQQPPLPSHLVSMAQVTLTPSITKQSRSRNKGMGSYATVHTSYTSNQSPENRMKHQAARPYHQHNQSAYVQQRGFINEPYSPGSMQIGPQNQTPKYNINQLQQQFNIEPNHNNMTVNGRIFPQQNRSPTRDQRLYQARRSPQRYNNEQAVQYSQQLPGPDHRRASSYYAQSIPVQRPQIISQIHQKHMLYVDTDTDREANAEEDRKKLDSRFLKPPRRNAQSTSNA